MKNQIFSALNNPIFNFLWRAKRDFFRCGFGIERLEANKSKEVRN